MKKWISNICGFYIDGFRNMTIGRTLWAIILIKLFVMFCIIRVFFMPDFLDSVASDKEKDDYVSGELILRAQEQADM
ncbi:MAG: DUF4492 domain-containing protein [Bacteroides sp.]|nr:DUF4492 domain-containing protein [Roseburia sp.]MCM1346856.1 DUF4492 domain-containing protein [Bacteroides sp.]MCM1419928.1 DUF4492 domain-containing protein [Bacteroides sp.]